jgi:hypothetical protein
MSAGDAVTRASPEVGTSIAKSFRLDLHHEFCYEATPDAIRLIAALGN